MEAVPGTNHTGTIDVTVRFKTNAVNGHGGRFTTAGLLLQTNTSLTSLVGTWALTMDSNSVRLSGPGGLASQAALRAWGQSCPCLGPQYEEAVARARQHVEQHIARAAQLGRPLVMEEFGIARDDESREPSGTTRMRDDYFERIFHSVLDSCKNGQP